MKNLGMRLISLRSSSPVYYLVARGGDFLGTWNKHFELISFPVADVSTTTTTTLKQNFNRRTPTSAINSKTMLYNIYLRIVIVKFFVFFIWYMKASLTQQKPKKITRNEFR